MNTNMFAIVKKIIAEQGETILDNPQRLKAFFADYAKDEPKQERLAFGRCVEMGCYAELKGCGSVEERQYKKTELATALHRNTGIDRPYCADALNLLEVVIFGEQEKNLCKNCGKEMQAGWKSCPFCENTVPTADMAGDQGKDKTRYYLSYNYKETGPYDKAAIESMAANRQITTNYFIRADNSSEWKPVTTLCDFPSGGLYGSETTPGSVTIHNGVTHIRDNAFWKKKLTSVIIPNGVTHIGAHAFERNKLVAIVIPASVTHIGFCAFRHNKLTSITFQGNTATTIESTAFNNNSPLEKITIGYNVDIINGFFEDALFGPNFFGFYTFYKGNGRKAGTYRKGLLGWKIEKQ